MSLNIHSLWGSIQFVNIFLKVLLIGVVIWLMNYALFCQFVAHLMLNPYLFLACLKLMDKLKQFVVWPFSPLSRHHSDLSTYLSTDYTPDCCFCSFEHHVICHVHAICRLTWSNECSFSNLPSSMSILQQHYIGDPDVMLGVLNIRGNQCSLLGGKTL